MKILTSIILNSSLLFGVTFSEAVRDYQNKNYEDAFKKFEQLSDNDNPNAQYNLALMYFQGIGVQKNDILGKVWLNISAQNGNKLAQNKLGSLYEKGEINGKVDLEKAIQNFKDSAYQNYSLAQYNLAVTYNEDYKKENLEKAVFWYKKAADNGNVAAMNNLANLYYSGQGIPKDLKKAYELYQKASKLGDGIAKFNLSMMYYLGDYVDQDDEKALKYLLESAISGTSVAQVRLGKFYLSGNSMVNQDYKKALTWFYEAAKQEYPAGMHQMGICYFYGYGVLADRKKAAFWFYQASDRGYKMSQDFIKKYNLTY